MSMTDEEWEQFLREEEKALDEFEKRREAEWKIYEDRYEDWY